jgi:hypothetical protein
MTDTLSAIIVAGLSESEICSVPVPVGFSGERTVPVNMPLTVADVDVVGDERIGPGI